MTILPFPNKRDLYPALKERHLDACLDDVAGLCRIAVQGNIQEMDFHTPFAALLTQIRAMHRETLPQTPVQGDALMMAGLANDANDIARLVKRSENSPRITGNEPGAADKIARYVIEDSREAIDTVLQVVLQNDENLLLVRDMVEEQRFDDLRRNLSDILAALYECPSGNALHAAINERLAGAGIAPTAEPTAHIPARTDKPQFHLVPNI